MARAVAADGVWKRLITDPLSGALLDHGRHTYRPPAALADFLRARDRHCRVPICRRRALDSQLDHTVGYHTDNGTTDEHNLYHACLCHHRMKDAPGWSVTQHRDGRLTWTTPTGHRYSSRPFDYRPEPDLVAVIAALDQAAHDQAAQQEAARVAGERPPVHRSTDPRYPPTPLTRHRSEHFGPGDRQGEASARQLLNRRAMDLHGHLDPVRQVHQLAASRRHEVVEHPFDARHARGRELLDEQIAESTERHRVADGAEHGLDWLAVAYRHLDGGQPVRGPARCPASVTNRSPRVCPASLMTTESRSPSRRHWCRRATTSPSQSASGRAVTRCSRPHRAVARPRSQPCRSRRTDRTVWDGPASAGDRTPTPSRAGEPSDHPHRRLQPGHRSRGPRSGSPRRVRRTPPRAARSTTATGSPPREETWHGPRESSICRVRCGSLTLEGCGR